MAAGSGVMVVVGGCLRWCGCVCGWYGCGVQELVPPGVRATPPPSAWLPYFSTTAAAKKALAIQRLLRVWQKVKKKLFASPPQWLVVTLHSSDDVLLLCLVPRRKGAPDDRRPNLNLPR